MIEICARRGGAARSRSWRPGALYSQHSRRKGSWVAPCTRLLLDLRAHVLLLDLLLVQDLDGHLFARLGVDGELDLRGGEPGRRGVGKERARLGVMPTKRETHLAKGALAERLADFILADALDHGVLHRQCERRCYCSFTCVENARAAPCTAPARARALEQPAAGEGTASRTDSAMEPPPRSRKTAGVLHGRPLRVSESLRLSSFTRDCFAQ